MLNNNAFPLVADIGGTHIRLALVVPQDASSSAPFSLQHISKKRCRDYPSPIETIQEYLAVRQCSVSSMCLAVAGPVQNGQANLTNHYWSFEQEQLKHAFNIEHVHIINDFHAQAMAVPYLQEEELLPISNRSSKPVCDGAPNLIIGPGTGLGVASLIHTPGGWQAVAGEGGHVDFAPRTTRDQIILDNLLNKQGFTRVSAEDLLSGRGIERLYRAHTWLETQEDTEKVDREIIRLALEENDAICLRVLEHFCDILGGVAGNAALTLGARGGVYIAGGLIPRFPDIFKSSLFRQAFEDKAPLIDYMKDIPVYAVLAEQPGLLGAAAILM